MAANVSAYSSVKYVAINKKLTLCPGNCRLPLYSLLSSACAA